MKKNLLKVMATLLICIAVMMISIRLGSVKVSFLDILQIILHKLFASPLPDRITAINADILWNIRLPRSLASFLVGGALAVTGTVMQSVLRNPLASSYTLGVSSGAGLGVALIVVFGFTVPFLANFTLPVVGFAFGMLTVFLAITIATRLDRNLENQTVILVGMVLSLFVGSLLTLVIALNREHLQMLIFWQLGSFSATRWSQVLVLAIFILPSAFYILRYALELDVMTFGEESALSVGIELKKTKLILISLSTFLTGTAVAFAGIIGFIDLIAPHVVRKIFGSSHRIVLPMSFLFGGAFMSVADIISRVTISPSELPIGAVTALIGAPFFTYVYFYRKGGRHA